MKLMELPAEFKEAAPIVHKLEAAGYEAYFVGGSVRDLLLNKPSHDVDIATSAFPAEVKQLFNRTIDVGIQHGTVMVIEHGDTYEITTFRTESTYQDFRRPDHVEFVRSLEEDLKRRDFTINALALQEDGKIIDLFDGLVDLREKVLRAVGNPNERFREDALRMMRALRFVSQLGFSLEPKTFAAIQENHYLLGKISIERINVEFTKIMLGDFRRAGIVSFVETECYLYCPGLRNAGEGLLRFADLPNPAIANEEQAWTLLCDAIELPNEKIRSFLKEWKCSNYLIKQVSVLLPALRKRKSKDWSIWDIYLIGRENANKVESMLIYFDREIDPDQIRQLESALPIRSLKELELRGDELIKTFNRRGGKWVKDCLEHLEEEVVYGEIPNKSDYLLKEAHQWMEESHDL